MQQRLPRITLNRIFSSFALKTSVPREIKVMDRDSIKILVMTNPIRNIQKKSPLYPFQSNGKHKTSLRKFFFFFTISSSYFFIFTFYHFFSGRENTKTNKTPTCSILEVTEMATRMKLTIKC